MNLTFRGRPLASAPPETVNYRMDAPAHRLLFDPFPRRVRALFAGRQVLDTTRGMLLHESNLLPQLYVPRDDVDEGLLRASATTTHCPFKGDAAYWSVVAGERTSTDAVWAYPEPMPDAEWLRGYLAPAWHGMDAWFDEDTEVQGHLRDPYTRLDVVPTSRHVQVVAAGEPIADSRRAVVLSETGLPNRYYVPAEDITPGVLGLSATHTVCPYKGTASYYSVHTSGGVIADGAFVYPDPQDGVRAIAGLVCFLAEGLETRAEGE